MTVNKNEELNRYFQILCKGNYPHFIDKYTETPELQRLDGVGFFCGVDYNQIPVLKTKYWYSRLSHSITCACMTWGLTSDKTQTLAALFHDVGIPAFSHSVDFMLNDTEKQESGEKPIEQMLENSKEIKEMLLLDNVNIEDIFDIKKYTIVENEKPKICVDRLDGIMATGLMWRQVWQIEDIEKMYSSVIVGINEENEKEITFADKEVAEMFMKGIYEYGVAVQLGEDKLSLNLTGDILFSAIENNVLKHEELYTHSEAEIIYKIENCDNIGLKDMWNYFKGLDTVIRSEELIENKYCISVDTKKRFSIPLVKTGDEFKRLVDISEKGKQIVQDYLGYKDSKFVSIDFSYNL